MSGMNTLNLYPQVYAEYIPMMAELEKQTYPFYSMEYAKEVMRDTLEKTFTEEEKAEKPDLIDDLIFMFECLHKCGCTCKSYMWMAEEMGYDTSKENKLLKRMRLAFFDY